jgi:hypothetical protein
MSFFTTAGFATPGIAALAAAGNASARVQGSTMRSGSTGHEAALQRISATVRESAVTRHQLDFQRVDRRAEALTTLKGTLIDLKIRMERKSGGRSHLSSMDSALQLACRAS